MYNNFMKEEFIPLLKLGIMRESNWPSALECEESRYFAHQTPLGVASLLIAAYECLSLNVKESEEIEFEKETTAAFIELMKIRAEHVETFRYGKGNFSSE